MQDYGETAGDTRASSAPDSCLLVPLYPVQQQHEDKQHQQQQQQQDDDDEQQESRAEESTRASPRDQSGAPCCIEAREDREAFLSSVLSRSSGQANICAAANDCLYQLTRFQQAPQHVLPASSSSSSSNTSSDTAPPNQESAATAAEEAASVAAAVVVHPVAAFSAAAAVVSPAAKPKRAGAPQRKRINIQDNADGEVGRPLGNKRIRGPAS